MNKLLFVLFKKDGISHEQCLKEWNGEAHKSIVNKVPGLIKWTQNHVPELPNESASNGIGELWFKDAQALQAAMNSPEMVAAVEDAKRFLNMEKTYALIVDEKNVMK